MNMDQMNEIVSKLHDAVDRYAKVVREIEEKFESLRGVVLGGVKDKDGEYALYWGQGVRGRVTAMNDGKLTPWQECAMPVKIQTASALPELVRQLARKAADLEVQRLLSEKYVDEAKELLK
jgi:hypothetical protein